VTDARRLIPLLAAAATLALPGCAAPPMIVASAGLTAFQEGSTAFIRGEIESADAIPLSAFYQASLEALNDLDFRITRSALGARSARIKALETGGRTIHVDLEKKSPLVTKVNIRVGVFGDQAVSRLIQQSISKHLPDPATVQPEPDRAVTSEATHGRGFGYNE
jgi:hypothetical protein